MGLRTSLLAVATATLFSGPVMAADLGGNCCADLEDRIAELEATTAQKGNRKIQVRVYGVVNEAIMNLSGDGFAGKWAVGQNSNVESFVGVAGEAVIAPHWKAGYVLEIGIGGSSEANPLASPFAGDSNTNTYTRRSFGYVQSDQLGRVSVGLANQATDGIAETSVVNTVVAARMLSIRPLVGAGIGDALDIFDGSRTNLVRYDSPSFYGAVLSASWATGSNSFGGEGKDVWDVALRWAGEGNGFKAAAGIGYREGIAIPGYANIGAIGGWGGSTFIEPKVFSGSASIKHIASGLFLNGAVGSFDVGGWAGSHIDNYVAWTIQGGAEGKLIPLGLTTVYAEYADSNADFHFGRFAGSFDPSYWGLGAVQHLDAAATDLYVSYRRYDLDDDNVGVFTAGVKVAF